MSQTIPSDSTQGSAPALDPKRDLRAPLTSAAFAPLASTGWIKVTGSDRVRWLNGMVTNSVGGLAPGTGNYNFILNAQGRIQGDGYVFAQPDHLLLETGRAQVVNLIALLDRFIIMDDVELSDLSPARAGLLLAGPGAADLLGRIGIVPPAAPSPPSLSLAHVSWRSRPLTLIHAYSPLVPRFELWSEASDNTNDTLLEELSAAVLSANALPCSSEALHALRIAEGTPLFGADIRDRDLPQETAQTRALHFAKGCYLGQEIVERIRSRGNVHRTFTGFLLRGAPASAGLALSVEGKPVGELTSVATLPADTAANHTEFALGYIRREALALGKPILYDGGAAEPVALPLDLARIL